VNVINLSLGPDTPLLTDGDQTLTQAVQRALNAGIVVVAAAGNHALPFCEQPSVNGPLLCVGAVDPDGNRAFYSNFSTGSGFGITAPGGDGGPDDSRNIVSTVGSGTGYAYEAGTSQATPHVSGVAALLASVGVRGQAAVNRIEQTAQDRGLPGPDPIYGAGIVDAAAAVAGYSLSGSAPGTVGASTAGTGTAARVSVPRIQRLRTVLRRGLVVRCLSAGSGRCSAYANGGRRRIVAGSRRLLIGRWTTLYARTTRRGRTLLLSALRHHRRIAALVRVRVPGVLVQVRRVSLRP
jgi:hypothetical protein